jgi:hypothetical protein
MIPSNGSSKPILWRKCFTFIATGDLLARGLYEYRLLLQLWKQLGTCIVLPMTRRI